MVRTRVVDLQGFDSLNNSFRIRSLHHDSSLRELCKDLPLTAQKLL